LALSPSIQASGVPKALKINISVAYAVATTGTWGNALGPEADSWEFAPYAATAILRRNT
jgi:hypothetical protein